MPQKPPAFQFYPKDWRSSPTVQAMSYHDKGVYIDLLGASWDSEEQGTLPLPLQLCSKITHIPLRILRRFAAKWPQCFIQSETKMSNMKLVGQAENYRQISNKRKLAAESRYANAPAKAPHINQSSSSTASASATKTNIIIPRRQKPTPPLEFTPEFLVFWEAYPKKVAKQEAMKSWSKNVNGNVGEVMEAIERLKPCRRWQEGFIPNPTTFLNQHRWTDQPDPLTQKEIEAIEARKIRERRHSEPDSIQ